MVGQEQWVITVIASGPDNPFDIVSEFLTELRVRGEYDIVSSAITPASGIGRATPVASSSKCNDNDNYEPATPTTNDDHYIRTYGEILAGVDGHDPATYAGISVGKHVR